MSARSLSLTTRAKAWRLAFTGTDFLPKSGPVDAPPHDQRFGIALVARADQVKLSQCVSPMLAHFHRSAALQQARQ
jgi:hypothetical protein